jgi:hypothetical protein
MSPITAQEGTAASLREPGSSNCARGPKPLIKTEYAVKHIPDRHPLGSFAANANP